jgi:hypothetical protein
MRYFKETFCKSSLCENFAYDCFWTSWVKVKSLGPARDKITVTKIVKKISSYLVLLRCHFVLKVMNGRLPKVFLHQYSWKVTIWSVRVKIEKNIINKQSPSRQIANAAGSVWLSLLMVISKLPSIPPSTGLCRIHYLTWTFESFVDLKPHKNRKLVSGQ